LFGGGQPGPVALRSRFEGVAQRDAGCSTVRAMSNAARQLVVAEDPTVYPIEDDTGEGSLQRFISELLRMLVVRWLESRGELTPR
jgi:hypothetical protein